MGRDPALGGFSIPMEHLLLGRGDGVMGCRGVSIGRASDPRSKDPRFELRQESKKTFDRFFPNQKWCADLMSVCPTPVYECIRMHKYDDERTLKNL